MDLKTEQALRIAAFDLARLELVEEGVEVRPLTLREIEDASGVPRSTLHVTEATALNKIRRHLRSLGEVDLPGLTQEPPNSPHAQ